MSIATSETRRRRTGNGVSAAAPAARAPVTPTTKDSGRTFAVVSSVILAIFAVFWLIPSLWALKTSFTPNAVTAVGAQDILTNLSPTLHSYLQVFASGSIWNWYLASAITSVVTVVLTVVAASMAAYPLSRLRFRGRRVVFFLLIGGIMIPPQVLILPVFQELQAVNLLNTYWAVIFPQVPAAIAVIIFKQFFDALPKELEESARLDGASFWRIYKDIIMPLSRPVVSAVSILTFVAVWNNLILPLYVIANPKLMTIPVGLATVTGSYGQNLADIQATAILGALPVILLFVFFQRRIIEGIAGTGLKG